MPNVHWMTYFPPGCASSRGCSTRPGSCDRRSVRSSDPASHQATRRRSVQRKHGGRHAHHVGRVRYSGSVSTPPGAATACVLPKASATCTLGLPHLQLDRAVLVGTDPRSPACSPRSRGGGTRTTAGSARRSANPNAPPGRHRPRRHSPAGSSGSAAWRGRCAR